MSTDWNWYAVRTRHDKGEITLYNYAPDAESAKRTVMAAERCPERAVLSVEQRNPPRMGKI